MDLTSSGLRSIEGAPHEHFADLVHGFGGVVFEDLLTGASISAGA
jgi:hypothetical protein